MLPIPWSLIDKVYNTHRFKSSLDQKPTDLVIWSRNGRNSPHHHSALAGHFKRNDRLVVIKVLLCERDEAPLTFPSKREHLLSTLFRLTNARPDVQVVGSVHCRSRNFGVETLVKAVVNKSGRGSLDSHFVLNDTVILEIWSTG